MLMNFKIGWTFRRLNMRDETSDWNILIVLLKSLKDEARTAGKIISFSEPNKSVFLCNFL